MVLLHESASAKLRSSLCECVHLPYGREDLCEAEGGRDDGAGGGCHEKCMRHSLRLGSTELQAWQLSPPYKACVPTASRIHPTIDFCSSFLVLLKAPLESESAESCILQPYV